MEFNSMDRLIEKYFSGETSIAEEKELKNYFMQPDVAPHHEQYRAMFGYFAQAKDEQFTKTVPLKPRKRNYVAWISVAASVALLFGLFTFLNQKPQEQDLGSFENPEVAYKETQKALEMVSQNVNLGVKGMGYMKEYEKTTKTIFK
ncbi:DUF3379 domain-containing protein [Flavobacterium supellecticarium]|uniref:DUF3379 domain-containing protein n=1 Tax=Flavobacterium supellecticarium TaxID=2565924 RepID=A0A4S3ZVX1_9FLAO|nr:DUF3379 domain-containing protein [Flavobacterium supellecticarium]THF49842.1 DUF3379 domain-containing protein [Flavobacterium supellecticarium]